MLGTLRRHYKYFLIATAVLVIPTFVIWGGYRRDAFEEREGRGEVARVNGTSISKRALTERRSRILRRLQNALGDSYDPDLFESATFVERALNELIDSTLFTQEAERLRIGVSQEAAEAYLRSWPIFFTDGKFNPDDYNEFITRRDIQWDAFLEGLKSEVRVARLISDVQDTAKLSDRELKEEYRLRNEQVKVKYLALNPSQFKNEVTVGEDKLKDYYENNLTDYIEPEKVKAKYVVARITPSDSDRQAVRDKAQEILDRIKAGEDFAELAKRYSEAPGASTNEGDIGWRDEGSFPEPIAAAVSKLDDGKLSDIVATEQDVYLFKCEGKKDEDGKKKIKLRQIMFRCTASVDTREKIATQIDALLGEARESGSLEVAAQKFGMELNETPLFSRRDRFIQGIGLDSQTFVRTAFALELEKPNDISSVLITPQAYYVLQLTEKRASRAPELSEVEELVRNRVAGQEALALAHKKAGEIASRITSLDELDTLDEKLASNVKISEPFVRGGYVPGVAGNRKFYNTAFSLSPGMLSAPILGENAAYLLEVIEKIPFDEKKFEEDKDKFREQLIAQKKSLLYNDWQQWLRARADIRLNNELIAAAIPGG